MELLNFDLTQKKKKIIENIIDIRVSCIFYTYFHTLPMLDRKKMKKKIKMNLNMFSNCSKINPSLKNESFNISYACYPHYFSLVFASLLNIYSQYQVNTTIKLIKMSQKYQQSIMKMLMNWKNLYFQ